VRNFAIVIIGLVGRLRSAPDLNLGCPQDAAREGHFGAYLLGQKDWRLVENIGKSSNLNIRLEDV
jgi:tRNA-dihydrouridine synthase